MPVSSKPRAHAPVLHRDYPRCTSMGGWVAGVWMDGWMDGWVGGGWVGWMDGWMGEWVGEFERSIA